MLEIREYNGKSPIARAIGSLRTSPYGAAEQDGA